MTTDRDSWTKDFTACMLADEWPSDFDHYYRVISTQTVGAPGFLTIMTERVPVTFERYCEYREKYEHISDIE